MFWEQMMSIGLSVFLAPLMLGVINRTKAFFSGRVGPPLCQTYFDLLKLSRKGAVFSRTTTWIFRSGPTVGLASFFLILLILPFGRIPALLHFQGDFILVAYLMGLARFFMVLSALDTGSSFEGMGASREVTFSTLAEPSFFLALLAMARLAGGLSLSEILVASPERGQLTVPPILLVTISLFVVLLAENARIPVDDPNTHLELTMIHEVMVLDHSGPDLAFILLGSAFKMWILSAILLGVLLPIKFQSAWAGILVFLGGMFALSVMIGIVESVMARLRLNRIPTLLIGAMACSLFALILVIRIKP